VKTRVSEVQAKPQNQNQKKPRRLLFRLFKGFIYGVIIGFFAGTGIYLLAAAVAAIATIPLTPAEFFALIFGSSAAMGTIAEYSAWLDQELGE